MSLKKGDIVTISKECHYSEKQLGKLYNGVEFIVMSSDEKNTLISGATLKLHTWSMGGWSCEQPPNGWKIIRIDTKFCILNIMGICRDCISTCKEEGKEECDLFGKK